MITRSVLNFKDDAFGRKVFISKDEIKYILDLKFEYFSTSLYRAFLLKKINKVKNGLNHPTLLIFITFLVFF